MWQTAIPTTATATLFPLPPCTAEVKMEYSNSDLTKSTDPKGYSYTYTYDKNHNVTQASSQRNVKYNYTYSKSGSNPLTLDITNSGGTMSLKSAAGYSGSRYIKEKSGQVHTFTSTGDQG